MRAAPPPRLAGRPALCPRCVTVAAKPPTSPADPAAGGGLAGGVSSLLYGAASRVERGSATCLQCRGTGSVECSECHVRTCVQKRQGLGGGDGGGARAGEPRRLRDGRAISH